MIIKNVKIFTPQKSFVPGVIVTRNQQIHDVLFGENVTMNAAEGETVLDGESSLCFPGMIDLHFHGCKGFDFCDGTREAVEEIARYEASIGVTAIAPATMTLPVDDLCDILANGAAYRKEQQKMSVKNTESPVKNWMLFPQTVSRNANRPWQKASSRMRSYRYR